MQYPMNVGLNAGKNAVNVSRNFAEKFKKFFVKGGKIASKIGGNSKNFRVAVSNRSVSAFKLSVDEYVSALAAGTVKFKDVPLKIAASHDFISKALQIDQDSAMKVMNSWDAKKMLAFIDQYDVLPEAMFGKLFACGLNPTLIPKDIKMSPAFLSVAININANKLVNEILNVEDIQSVRLAIKALSDDSIKLLWATGLSMNKIPSEQLSSGKFSNWAISVDKKRFEKESLSAVVRGINVKTSLEGRISKSL